MKVVGYAYPWDVTDPGFAQRAQDLGVDEVAVAVAYHSARAATPWAERTTAVHVPRAALYRPVRDETWAGQWLRPATADWPDDPDPAGTAIRLLHDADLPAAAWVVLTHSSHLGTAHPDLSVRNCFDERYPWALCSSHPEVRAYAARLAAESVRDLELDTVVLEACGQMGAVHQCEHEKTDAVWSPALVQVLSTCCCSACAAGWSTPAESVRGRLRAEARRLVNSGSLTETEPDLPAELRADLLATRQAVTDALREQVLAALPGRPTVALHGSADPWATGALPGLTEAAGNQVDTVVLPNWRPGSASRDEVRLVRQRLPAATAVGSYVTAVAADPLADPATYVRELRDAGSTELHLYHLGLASPARWPDLRAAVAAAHEPEHQADNRP